MRDKEQQKIGKYADKVAFVRKCGNDVDENVLMNGFSLNKETLDKIIFLIDNKPEWDDEKIAEAVINGQSE